MIAKLIFVAFNKHAEIPANSNQPGSCNQAHSLKDVTVSVNGMAFTKFELLTSPSFEKIRILSILFLTTQRDPRKFPASTAVPVLALPSSYLKVPSILSVEAA